MIHVSVHHIHFRCLTSVSGGSCWAAMVLPCGLCMLELFLLSGINYGLVSISFQLVFRCLGPQQETLICFNRPLRFKERIAWISAFRGIILLMLENVIMFILLMSGQIQGLCNENCPLLLPVAFSVLILTRLLSLSPSLTVLSVCSELTISLT